MVTTGALATAEATDFPILIVVEIGLPIAPCPELLLALAGSSGVLATGGVVDTVPCGVTFGDPVNNVPATKPLPTLAANGAVHAFMKSGVFASVPGPFPTPVSGGGVGGALVMFLCPCGSCDNL